MPTQTDKAGVQQFLGLVGYVSKFIQNLSQKAKPLRAWHWEQEYEEAFNKLKTLLIKLLVLKYHNANEKPTSLQYQVWGQHSSKIIDL